MKEVITMARVKQRVEAKNYEILIKKENELLAQLEIKESEIREDIKTHKVNLKKLEKDFEAYKIQKAEDEKKQKASEIVNAILESGKDLDEIKALLLGDGTKTKEK